MVTLLASGPEKVLRIFHENKRARLHLREIARRTALHEPSTTAVLKRLEQDGLLRSEQDGNQKKYSLRFNDRTYAMLALLDGERFHALPNIRRNAVHRFIESLQEKPVAAVLFGSTAKGTHKPTSDIDLLIVTNRKIATADAEKQAEALTGIKVSVFQITLNSFVKEIKLREDPVVQAALSTGFPVFNAPYYYELCNEPAIPR